VLWRVDMKKLIQMSYVESKHYLNINKVTWLLRHLSHQKWKKFLLFAILKIKVFVLSATLIKNSQIFDTKLLIAERKFYKEVNLSLICCNRSIWANIWKIKFLPPLFRFHLMLPILKVQRKIRARDQECRFIWFT